MMVYTSEGGSIFYKVSGPEDARTIVLTHGAGLHSGMFDQQVEALQSRYRVITWDMPGHGQSYRLDGELPVEKMSGIIIGILDELGIKRAVVVGQSLGSWVAQHTAITYPERVSGVVSISGTPIEKPTGKMAMYGFKVWLAISRLLPIGPMFRFTAKSKAISQQARDFALDSMLGIGKKQFLFIVAGMLTAEGIKVPHGARKPMLITHGDHEMPKFVEKVCRQWYEATPGSSYFVIPNAGHNGNQDNPGAFNAALIDYMSTH